MIMPGRRFSAGGSYRFGFNGKEDDDEVKGDGNQQDYGMRIYDPRLGRFLSVDPLTKCFAMLTPYQYASNRPIDGIDLDGLEYITFHVKITKASGGKPAFSIFYKEDYRGMSAEAMASIHNNPDYATDFYKLFSESFGPEGRGFKWVYFDENGNQIGNPVWQMRQSRSLYFNGGNSGYFSGAGSITKFGPGPEGGAYSELSNNYDFSYEPMSFSDAISKRHDMLQEQNINQTQGWLEDVRTLKSDRILLSDAKRGIIFNQTNSREDLIRTTNITIFFSAVIRYKEWKKQKMLELKLDVNSPSDQRKVILSDWKPAFLTEDWYAKQLRQLSGGGAKEKDRGVVKPISKKNP
jgi:RHS repeat-associated protein